jgi:predicted dehydrogenase
MKPSAKSAPKKTLPREDPAMSTIINPKPLAVTIVGGGMIVHDQILPSLYHLQRLGQIGPISIVDMNTRQMRELAAEPEFARAFPGQTFTAYPDLSESPDHQYPDLFKRVIAQMPPYNIVVIALPDQLHYMGIKFALSCNQHVMTVKPLVLSYAQAEEIEQEAYTRGCFVGIEYHKRFDRRALEAKKRYAAGQFGTFVIGEAKLIEPYYYRHSNFQNWFTWDKTDPFVYVGCHYTDLTQFITGLKPVEVSVRGIKLPFPNGNLAFMWSSGRIVYENGGILTVTNGLGYPDLAAGSNEQCLSMYFEGPDKTGHLRHNDQFRGVEFSYLDPIGPGGKPFNYINPDYFRLVPWEGDGLRPVGYGYESIAAIITTIGKIEAQISQFNLTPPESLARRQQEIKTVDAKGIIATPTNSKTNELVMEAARLSILNDGKTVKIQYSPDPRVELI